MSIRIVCPSCQTACNIKEELVGKRVRCPRCKASFDAEAPDEPREQRSEHIAERRRPAPSKPVATPRRRPGPDDEDDDRAVRRRRPEPEEEDEDRVARRRRPEDDDEVAPRRRKAYANEDDEDEERPRRKQPSPPKKKFPLALLIGICAGAGALVIGAFVCVFLLVWNAKDIFNTDGGEENRVVKGGLFAPQDPEQAKKAAEQKKAKKESAKPADPPPPPPTVVSFLSPIPVESTPAPTAPANAQLSVDILQKVKGATVYLAVHRPDGNLAQGSGFFGVEPNVVLTNAHVVGMLHEETPPKSIDVVRNSGTPEEKKYSAEVVGVDRGADLAVLRVNIPGAPPPLEVRSAKNLHETQQVWVIGFPLGAGLGKEVTVSGSSVSSFRKDNGVLSKVQVNGGMQPGNSGGPVVDAAGNVIGVAVSIIRNTQINFAVPGDFVHLILNGRVSSLTVSQPSVKNGTTHAKVVMRTIDPMKRIREPAIEVWAGDAGAPERPASFTAPQVQPGDSPHQRYPLKYKDEVARGEITLPPLPSGKVYWIQPVWANIKGGSQWTTAHVMELPPAVEERPVMLAVKHQVGSRPLVLNHWADTKLHHIEGGEAHLLLNTEASLNEITETIDKDDCANERLQYRDFNHEMRWESEVHRNDRLDEFRPEVGKVQMTLRVDKQGNVLTQQDVTPFVQLSPSDVADLQEQFGMVRTLAIPLPNKQVEPGESWKAQRPVSAHVMRGGRFATGNLDMTYTYVGVRKAGGREEAVLALEGEFPKRKKNESVLTGRAHGTAVLNLATGEAEQVDLVIYFNVDSYGFAEEVSNSNGRLTLRLRRNAPSTVASK